MSVDLDPPYPDESLFSVVARYMEDLRVGNKVRFLKNLFGYQQRLSVTLAYGLERVADETRHVWGLSSDELAEQLTLYPYYAALLPMTLRDGLLVAMRQKQRKPSPLIVHSTLRYCEDCRATDRAAGRPEYWRRSHLLPGVMLCLEHGRCLSEISSKELHFLISWPTLQSLSEMDAHPIALDPNPAQFDAWERVARACVWLLNNRVSTDVGATLAQFKVTAWRAGYTFGPRDLDCRRLTRHFIEFYGEPYLLHSGSLPTIGNNNWLAKAVNGHLPPRFTTRAVLVAIFMASLRERDSGVIWPTCPNSIAYHGPEHIVEHRTRIKGGRFAGKCSCGFRFTYSRTEAGVPQDVRPTLYGHSHAELARKLERTGATLTDIANVIGVSPKVVSRLLKGNARVAAS
jgi:hypothetical protein